MNMLTPSKLRFFGGFVSEMNGLASPRASLRIFPRKPGIAPAGADIHLLLNEIHHEIVDPSEVQ